MTVAAKTAQPLIPTLKARDVMPSFGTTHRSRRKPLPPSAKSNAELIAEFLAKREVTQCAPRYADGAVPTSGDYHW